MLQLIFLTILTAVIGLGAGGVIGVLFGGISRKANALLLSFSAGTMIALICFELLHEAMETGMSTWFVALFTLLGAGLVSLLDYLIDKRSGHSHDFITCEDCDEEFEHDSSHQHCEEHDHGHVHRHDHGHNAASFVSGAADSGEHDHGEHDHEGHDHEHEAALSMDHDHEHHGHGEYEDEPVPSHHHKKASHLQLLLAGIMMAVGVAIHNIPEGMSIGAIYYENGSVLNASLGILLISVVLHNIPEGMAIALPLYTSGMSKPRAALLAASTGIPAVLGAMLGYAIGDMGALGMTISLSFAAGTLLYVVFGEVLPQSINLYCSRKTAFAAIAGLVLGMLIIGMHVH